MRFYSLYPSENHLLLDILGSSDCSYKWNEKGELEESDKREYKQEEIQLTEAGFDSLRLAFAFKPPHSWPEADKNSPLLNIPDNIENSWLWELFHFYAGIEKLNDGVMKKWIQINVSFSGCDKPYKDDYLERYYHGYLSVRKLMREKKISERIMFIMNENAKPKGYVAPLKLKVGSVVRLKTGVDTAIVLTDNLKLGGEAFKICQLSVPLEGSVYWKDYDLKVVKE